MHFKQINPIEVNTLFIVSQDEAFHRNISTVVDEKSIVTIPVASAVFHNGNIVWDVTIWIGSDTRTIVGMRDITLELS